MTAALLIFIATYAAIGVGRLPGLRVAISFVEYLKVGVPITILTILVGIGVLLVQGA